MYDDEGTFAAALAGNACYICGSVVHIPDPKTGICPREADEALACDDCGRTDGTHDPEVEH